VDHNFGGGEGGGEGGGLDEGSKADNRVVGIRIKDWHIFGGRYTERSTLGGSGECTRTGGHSTGWRI